MCDLEGDEDGGEESGDLHGGSERVVKTWWMRV